MSATIGVQEYRVHDLDAGAQYMTLAHDATEAVQIVWAKYFPGRRGVVSHFRSNGRDITAMSSVDDGVIAELFTYGA